jgi:hypothetical protein
MHTWNSGMQLQSGLGVQLQRPRVVWFICQHLCVSHFLCCCDRSEENNLKGGFLDFGSGDQKFWSLVVGRMRKNSPHGCQEAERQTEMDREAETHTERFSPLSLFYSLQAPVYGMIPLTFREGLSPLGNPLWKRLTASPRGGLYQCRCVSTPRG